jgi:signal transduction histidine kinase/ligand-binding sensor domain-containing protein
MRAASYVGIVFLCIHFAAYTANAQQYFFTGYTPRNGLVNNRVSSIFQDSRGRMFFGTYGGLSIYDGAHFINYTTSDGLASGLVNDFAQMGDDSLWIISNSTTLQCLAHGILRTLHPADGFCPVINQLLRCHDGHFYAIADEGLFRLEGNRFIRIPVKDSTGMDCGRYLNHAIEFRGRLFIVNDPNLENIIRPASLLVYDPVTQKTIRWMDKVAFFGALESPGHDLLLNTSAGIRMLDTTALGQQRLRLLPPPYPYSRAGAGPFKCLFFDHTRGLWLAATTSLTRIDPQGKLQTFAPLNGLPAVSVNFILQDRENNMWFGSDQNGAMKLVNPQLEFYGQLAPGFTSTDIACNNDSVWAYDAPGHRLLLLHGDTRKVFSGQGHPPAAGRILMGKRSYLVCSNSIYTLQFQGSHYRTRLLFRDSNSIEGHLCFDNNGDLVVVAKTLVLLLGNTIVRKALPALCDQVVVDRDNRFWVVTRSDQLFIFRVENTATGPEFRTVQHYDKLLPGNCSPRSAALDSMGRLWVGTRDHGLFCLESHGGGLVIRGQVTMPDGLSENFVDFLHCDGDNYIWAGTPTGLDKTCFRQGHIMVENITPSNEHYTAIYEIGSLKDGSRWALTRGGCIRIAAGTGLTVGTGIAAGIGTTAYRPGIFFSKVQDPHGPVPNGNKGSFSLSYDRNTINFLVGAPTFINEGLTRYSYLLEGGRDKEWSVPAARADIDLVNLPAGNYKLHVKAEFLNGRYPEATAVYPFVITPPWWQTWWFWGGSGLMILLLVCAWTRYYIRSKLEIHRSRLEKEQAVEKERTRIATDMHDDLGAGLSQIKFLSETIQLKKQAGIPVHEDLGTINRYATEMIEKMSEIVWALNEKNDSLNDLLAYTRRFAADYLLQCGIECSIDIHPASCVDKFVSGEFRRNVYLTVKEALHNIVKHSEARKVCIRIAVDKELAITIKDNGIGIGPAGAPPDNDLGKGSGNGLGNGLGNMHRRIRAIGGRLDIVTREGTTLKMKVPL